MLILMQMLHLSDSLRSTAFAASAFYYKVEGTCSLQIRAWTPEFNPLPDLCVYFAVQKPNCHFYNFVTVKNKMHHVPLKWQCVLAWC